MNLQEYFDIFEKYADACFIFNRKGEIVFANEAVKRLFKMENFTGLKVHDLTPNPYEKTDELISQTIRKRFLKFKYNYKTELSQGVIQINMKTIGVDNSKGELFLLALLVDITDEERKKVESDDTVRVLDNELTTLKMMYSLSNIFLKNSMSIKDTLEQVIEKLSIFYSGKYSFYILLQDFNVGLKTINLHVGKQENNLCIQKDIYVNSIKCGFVIVSSNYNYAVPDDKNVDKNIDIEVFENVINQIISYLNTKYTNGYKEMTEVAVRDSSDSIIITDIDSRIVYVNQAFTDKSGYYFEEVIGQTPSILNSGKMDKHFFQEMWQTITNGIVWEGHIINKRRSGEIYEDDVTISPIREHQTGKVIGFVSLQKDVTQELKMRKMLDDVNKKRENLESIISMSASVAFMIKIVNNNDNGVYKWKILYMSDNIIKYFGYSPDEFYNDIITFDSFICEEDKERVFKEIFENVANDTIENYHQKCRVNTKNEGIKWIDISTFVNRDHGGEMVSIQGVFKDISENIKIEGQLNQAQKMESIGQLASGIAHEINSPSQFVSDNITFLKGGVVSLFNIIEKMDSEDVNALKEKYDYDFLKDEIPLAIDQSMDGMDRITKIVVAMKTFSHPGSEGKMLSNINENIESTVTISKNSWKYVAELTFIPDTENTMINCYIDEINQVILNMIVNSVHAIEDKFGKEGCQGRIEISVKKVEQYIMIQFSDNGIGIDKKNRSRIFDPFFTTKEVGRGTGQGLALTYDIVYNKHNGFIELDSTIGEGTTFKVYLPME